MKKNKGFTLVELLAVIAILAVLVIVALPNVIGMFNDAKGNSFTTECKQIYKVAQQQYISDSLFETQERTYARCRTEDCGTELDLSGRSNLYYLIKFNKAGKVTEFYVTDGDYQYEYSNGDLLITDIAGAEQVAELDPAYVLSIYCDSVDYGVEEDPNTTYPEYLYYSGDSIINVGDTVTLSSEYPDLYSDYSSAMNAHKYYSNESESYPIFIRLKMNKNKVQALDLGYYLNNNVYYVRGLETSAYQTNKSTLMNSFNSSYCENREYNAYNEDGTELIAIHYAYSCNIPPTSSYPGLGIEVNDDGNVHAFDGSYQDWSCTIYHNSNVPGASCLAPW